MNTPTPKDKLRRAVWLAFQASSPMGYGFLHAGTAAKLTEETLLEDSQLERGRVYTDYLCGRMMKTDFEVDESGKLAISPEEPRSDYQSWGRRYRSASEIVKAVEESFAATPPRA